MKTAARPSASSMMLCVSTRSSSSCRLPTALRARMAEPRLRLIMLLAVSACQRWPYARASALRLKRWYMFRRIGSVGKFAVGRPALAG
ncbi:MAG TPA: hypothetical protein VGN72_13290 [Tepidisphaeraceae bacterium]|nr:hypothetical protein [Tepidisphaeraceae bacterium]